MTFDIHIGPNLRLSPFFEATVADGVRSFSVYNQMYMPGHFGDPGAEYDRLLNGVAMWDVAAERQVEIEGPDALALVQYLTARDLSAQKVGQGRYVPLCDHAGWLINDPVCLKLAHDRVWLSVADSDVWLWALAVARERGMAVEVREPDVSPLAIQGPKAVEVAAALFGDAVRGMKHFAFVETAIDGIPLVLARSGWSKQGGFELYLRDGSRGGDLWALVKAAGAPWDIGPGAPNDVERIEGGLISYGADMRHAERRADPFEMGMEKMVSLDTHDFIGRAALRAKAKAGRTRRRTGLLIEGEVGANRRPLPLLSAGARVGTVSETVWSRRLDRGIGLALVAADVSEGAALVVETEDGPRAARLTDLPFV